METFHLLKLIFFTLTLFILPSEGDRKITRACDGKEIQLICSQSEYIRVRSAFFGRFEKSYCNSQTTSDLAMYKTCINANETHVLTTTAEKCDNRTVCKFNVTTHLFGGSCENNAAYLEVVYDCVEYMRRKAVACQGAQMTLKCPAHHEIEILDAYYGRMEDDESCLAGENITFTNCISPVTYEKTSETCNGKSECKITATSEAFGNPCPGVKKYLSVTHRCPPRIHRRLVVCEGDGDLVLTCPVGKFINIESLDWGRKDMHTCPGGPNPEKKCTTPFGTEISKMRCNGKDTCSIRADNLVFGDPCPDSLKYLEVYYQCLTFLPRKEVSCMGSPFKLSCQNEMIIDISSSYFGRFDNKICRKDNKVDYVCYNPSTLSIISDMCEGRSNCSSNVSGIFGDPCPMSSGYLEAHYTCMPKEHITLIACEGENMLISCPLGYYIEVEDALFGRADEFFCPHGQMKHLDCSTSAKSYVEEMCNYHKACKVLSSRKLFGEPCEETPSYLEVKYTCHKWRPISKIACDGETLDLTCPAGLHIRIKDANYGRRDSSLCRGSYKKPYIPSCYSHYSRAIIQEKCSALNSCSLEVSQEVFEDPCPQIPKYLDVTYECINYITN